MTDWNTLTKPQTAGPMNEPTNAPATAGDARAVKLPDTIIARLNRLQLPANADGVLMLHQQVKQSIVDAQADEMELRKLVVQVFVPTPREGMNNVELGNGYKLKAAVKYTYNLKAPEGFKGTTVDAVDGVAANMARISNEGAFIADRLFKYDVSLVLSEYRKLCEEAEQSPLAAQMLKELNKVLEIKDAAPTIEIKEPKLKK